MVADVGQPIPNIAHVSQFHIVCVYLQPSLFSMQLSVL